MNGAAVVLAGASAGGGSGSGLLGVALLILLGVALCRGGRKQVRWEYTGKDGRQHFTDWYDADTHFVVEHPERIEIHRREP